jgi:ferredoxin
LTEKKEAVTIKNMAKVLKVDKEVCIGCGTCTVLAPKSFKLDPSGKAEPINPPADDPETIKEAIDSCPVQAIKEEENE